MNSVNSLPSERFTVAAKIDTASVTNSAVESGWMEVGHFSRLCGILNIGTVAGANTITVSLRRADDADGNGDEAAHTIGTFLATATTIRVFNFDMDREKGNAKRFIRVRVIGNSGNAVQLTAAVLGFDPSFAPGSDRNITTAALVA